MGDSLRAALIEEIDKLTDEQQGRLLSHVRELSAPEPNDDRPQSLMDLAGTLSKEDADRMRQAIEEECERVDHDGW